jgi:hypothetical protein
MVGVFASILKVKRSNFRDDVFEVNSGKLTEYFPMEVLKVGAYLG